VVRKFEARRGPVECFRTEAPACRIVSGCLLRGAFEQAAEAFYGELDRHSLADLLENRPTLVRLLSPRAPRPHA
jgi:Rrf2 family nitric oxide-sensitive transcriptional repressor